jgi:hypothetical protein
MYGSDKATVRHWSSSVTTGVTFCETQNSKRMNYCVLFWSDELRYQGTLPFTHLKAFTVLMIQFSLKTSYNSTSMSFSYFISLLTIWEARTFEYSGLLNVPPRHHHPVVSLKTGPQPLPKRNLHRVWSSAYSFNYQHPHLYLKSSRSCLHLPPRLPFSSIIPAIFPSIKCFRRQFLRKMWPIMLAFFHFTVCRIFLSPSSTLSNASFLTRSAQIIFSILLQQNISKLPRNF